MSVLCAFRARKKALSKYGYKASKDTHLLAAGHARSYSSLIKRIE